MYDIYDLPKSIPLGRQGEQYARAVEIDCAKMLNDYPGARLTLMQRRTRGETARIVKADVSDTGVITWSPDMDAMAVAGLGAIEIVATVDDKVAKSVIAATAIAPSLTPPDTDTQSGWVKDVLDASDAAQGAMAAAETSMIARDIALALDTGARVLFQHVSSGQSAALIRAGKALGAKIYAEVTPHHLSLTEDDVPAHGTCARMNPPLRREADRQALIEALADGTIDMIATDHAPHTAEEKARDFAKAPSGITGLETAFSVCNTYLVKTGRLTPMQLLEKMSRNPAEVYGLTGRAVREGNYARLVLLDWDSEKIYSEYKSKGINTPYTNEKLTGSPRAIVTGEKITE